MRSPTPPYTKSIIQTHTCNAGELLYASLLPFCKHDCYQDHTKYLHHKCIIPVPDRTIVDDATMMQIQVKMIRTRLIYSESETGKEYYMNKIRLLLLCCILLSGCSIIPTSDDEVPAADKNETETQMTALFTMDTPNPYTGYSESSTPWRYDLFEIAKGSQYLNFAESLEYKRDYSAVTVHQAEEFNGLLHKYSCVVSLPQATGDEPWVSQINDYYQQLMPELIAEGDIIWEETINNVDMKILSYHYVESFQYGNVVNVVRSRCNYGTRPSVSHEPFADMFSAIDGRHISLDDLFCVDKETYLPALHSSLANASMCFAQYYDPGRDGDFRIYPDNPILYFDYASVAVTSFGLIFIYPTGFVSAMSDHTVFLKVPFEDLEGMLNPVYFPDC